MTTHDNDLPIGDVCPKLVVTDAAAAIDFYRQALGAREEVRHAEPGGRIAHAEITVGNRRIAVKDEDSVDPAPTSLGGTPVIITLQVSDADQVAAAMVRAGATEIFEVADRSYGQRDGRLTDPYGHLWMVSQPVAGQ